MKKTHYLAGLVLMSAALPALAADDCTLTIEGNDAMQFDQKELSVPASCDEVTLTLEHTGKLPVNTMGHNWVLSKTDDMQGIASDGVSAGADHASGRRRRGSVWAREPATVCLRPGSGGLGTATVRPRGPRRGMLR